jgi:DNA polymerase/3'-5' exonuclease PolX
MNYKEQILEALDKLRKQEIVSKDKWRALAYSKAIKALEDIEEIKTIDDIKDIKNIGKGILSKIEEIIETGKLVRLNDYNADHHIAFMDELTKIYGIGPAKAKDLIEKHEIKSIQDLKNNMDILNDKQKIGLKYYEDILLRIPRKEMIKHDEFIQKIIKEIDEKLIAEIVGSYRRGMKDSGDIDILINHTDDPTDFKNIIKAIVENMKKSGYIIEELALGDKKYMGICKLKRHKRFRRIDILYTTRQEFPFSKLYFTGSKELNVAMRNICLSKNMSLSEHGIKKNNTFIKDKLETEEDIFNFLGYKYIPPIKRDAKVNLEDYKL